MTSSSPILPLPFKFRRKSSSPSEGPSSSIQSWFQASTSSSPLSSPPASSSPPPISPYSAKGHNYAHINTSPQIQSDFNLRNASDVIDDMSMVWGPDDRWNSSIKSPPTHCRLPSFRSSFPSDDELPGSDFEMSDYSEDTRSKCEPISRPRPTVAPENVFYSDSEEETNQDDDAFEFNSSDIRSTYFDTSAERGRWKSDPMPYRWLRSSAPVTSTPTSFENSLRRDSERRANFHEATEQASLVTKVVTSKEQDPSPVSSGDCLEHSSLLQQLSDTTTNATEIIGPFSPLPPSSPPIPPTTDSPYARSPSPISLSPLADAPPTSIPTQSLVPCDASDDTQSSEGGALSSHAEKNVTGDGCSDLGSRGSQDMDHSCDAVPGPIPSNEPPFSSADLINSTLASLSAEESHQLPAQVTAYISEFDEDDSLSTISSLSPVSSRSSSPLSSIHDDEDSHPMVVVASSDSLSLSRKDMSELLRADIEMSDISSSIPPSVALPSCPSVQDDDKENRKLEKAKVKSARPKPAKPIASRTDVEHVASETSGHRNTTPVPAPKKAKRKPKDASLEEGPSRKKARVSSTPAEELTSTSKGKARKPEAKASKDTGGLDESASVKPRNWKAASVVNESTHAGQKQPVRLKPSRVSVSDPGPYKPLCPSISPSDHSGGSKPSPSTQQTSESHATSVQQPTTPSDQPPEPIDTTHDAEICGLIIESLALSRASAQAISTLYGAIMRARPTLQAQRSEDEWMDVFQRVLSGGDEAEGGSGIFGKVESSGKDDADRPLEAKWFYVPEKDEDQERATVIRSMMPRPGKRSVTKKYKQYYYQPLGKISRWDPEDEL
ncbi:hypothetical protein PC9H_007167 [Pleurotus ostreatus]|uniref:Uncharacterized protein n=2 Tax=Pleurotus ostreatus TaxID=5322 RepID=A0A8H6ZQS5_PLEOS|nr:uncharacterized protein PC9H_007167 [Pleurotus ostreatus]KAF7427950.1 hypothetical protein PC9H_007167 [Pleurotus ostreatus]KAJ8695978.1 hypothetical protein PTI98_005882 [Pleurotus ostreatus]